MADMQFGLMLRAQFPQGDDMQVRFQEMLEQARLADELGYSCITNGMHYSSAPWQDFPDSSELGGGGHRRAAKAARGADVQIEPPVACWDGSTLHCSPPLTGVLGASLIRHQRVAMRSSGAPRLLAALRLVEAWQPAQRPLARVRGVV